jgi:CRISPR system Cascade subunit CasB
VTTATQPADATTVDTPPPWRARRRQPFGGHVAATVEALQQKYLKKQSGAISTMAHLRAAAGKPPGYQYTVLAETHVPDKYLHERPGDEPTDVERVKHTALTLYALHQQSTYDQPMHRDGPGLGVAISLLTRAAASPEAVRRRFATLGTASTYDETVYHLRSLIHQLRDKKIAFDYGLLADDLVTLLRPDGHERIRARWGRDFYRVIPAGDTPDPTTERTPDSTATHHEE